MVHVARIKEADQLIATNTPVQPHSFALLQYPFQYFNPIQSATYPYSSTDVNLVVACATSAGKTIVAESYLADSIWKGNTGIYMAPLRAVVSEKYDDWTNKNYGFGVFSKAKQLNVSILTGDYRLTKDRQEELYSAHLIVLTPEMMDSRTRRMQMETNAWLNRVGTICVDECHLIGLEDRGHRLESALMRFSSMNKCRIVGLSATMPNVEDMARWFSKLNGKPTLILESIWRPVKLNKHIVKVQISSQNYRQKQKDLANAALSLVQTNVEKTILFVHTKATGKMMLEMLQKSGMTAAFHSSSAVHSERNAIEHAFKSDPNFRTLVSTSTLAYGINMPARNVIIIGAKRGQEEVHPYDIAQMFGRAGRMGFDKEGTAYLLLPSDTFTTDSAKYAESALPPIESHLRNSSKDISDDDVLAFHAVSEVAEVPKRAEQLLEWYKRSFAFSLGKNIELSEMIEFCDHLVSLGVFYKVNDYYQATNLGKIASWMYLSPFDIVDLYKNWMRVFKNGIENEAAAIAFALFNIHTERESQQYAGLPYDLINEWTAELDSKLTALNIATRPNPMMCVYAKMLDGKSSDVPNETIHMLSAHRLDMDRFITACELIDKMHGRWNKKLFWRLLSSRVTMGVTANQAELCMVRGIGAAFSKNLCDHGITSLKDLTDPVYAPIASAILKNKYESVMRDARNILSEIEHADSSSA